MAARFNTKRFFFERSSSLLRRSSRITSSLRGPTTRHDEDDVFRRLADSAGPTPNKRLLSLASYLVWSRDERSTTRDDERGVDVSIVQTGVFRGMIPGENLVVLLQSSKVRLPLSVAGLGSKENREGRGPWIAMLLLSSLPVATEFLVILI